jgi:hypothetical protein
MHRRVGKAFIKRNFRELGACALLAWLELARMALFRYLADSLYSDWLQLLWASMVAALGICLVSIGLYLFHSALKN